MTGRSKKEIFHFIQDRVRKKLHGWKESLLSQAGKEVLVKAVIQAIPSYAMQCFQLPNSICDSIMMMTRQFWWGKNQQTRNIHWASWGQLCKPKRAGGLGFRQIQDFNLALLAKQGWRLVTNPTSLVARVLRAKYHAGISFMEATLGPRPSYLWRSLLAGHQILDLGLRYRVGTGSNIRIWDDRWIPIPFSFKPSHINRHLFDNGMVKDLILEDSAEWNRD